MRERTMTMATGMTIADVRALFADTFPGLTIVFWDGSIEFYKEGHYPEYQVAEDEVVANRDDPRGAIALTAAMTARQVRDAVCLRFGYETEIQGLRDPAGTLGDNMAPTPCP